MSNRVKKKTAPKDVPSATPNSSNSSGPVIYDEVVSVATTEYDRLKELLKSLPPMTEEERRAQKICFAYGNTALSNPDITREMVEEVLAERERKGK